MAQNLTTRAFARMTSKGNLSPCLKRPCSTLQRLAHRCIHLFRALTFFCATEGSRHLMNSRVSPWSDHCLHNALFDGAKPLSSFWSRTQANRDNSAKSFLASAKARLSRGLHGLSNRALHSSVNAIPRSTIFWDEQDTSGRLPGEEHCAANCAAKSGSPRKTQTIKPRCMAKDQAC